MKRKTKMAAGSRAAKDAAITLNSSRRRRGRIAISGGRVLLAIAAVALFGQRDSLAQQPVAEAEAAQPQLSDLLDSIPPYHPKQAVDGKALLAGSTTMLQLGQQWATRFKQFHPHVEFTRGGNGSQTALELLQQNPAAIAGLSRMVTGEEVAALKRAECPDPAVVVVAVEPLAIYVHQDNPLKTATPQQIQRLFAASNPPTKWSDLGIEGPLGDQPVRVHSRTDDDSFARYVSDAITHGKPLAKPAATHRSGAELIKAVAADPAAVALGSLRADLAEVVKPLSLELEGGIVEATEANLLSGRYPLIRPLTLIFEKSMLDRDGGLRREILHYVLSRDGQAEAVRAGFFPVSPNFIAQQIASLSGPQLR